MNYLAHAYLSFNHTPTLVGNMISDYVKGKKKYDYPINIQQGIALHRAIDNFTDFHVATAEAKQFFKPSVGLYAGAFVDVVYDHFLALDKDEFQNTASLQNFANNVYSQLENNKEFLPEKYLKILPYMQLQNWLYNYQFLWGIEKSFEGLVRRAAYLDSSANAFIAFQNNYQQLYNCYQTFFKDVKKMALNHFELNTNF